MIGYWLVAVPWKYRVASLSFKGKPVGASFTGCVARAIDHGDLRPQTDFLTGSLVVNRDGSPRWVMLVPLTMAPSLEFPDGRATWFCKSADWKALDQALAQAGVTPVRDMMVPEAGARITVTYTGDRRISGLLPQKIKTVTYQRPES